MGIVGLGQMGGGLAFQALEKGIRVVGLSKGGASPELVRAGLAEADGLEAAPAASYRVAMQQRTLAAQR